MGRIDAAVTANLMYFSRDREAIPCNKNPASFGTIVSWGFLPMNTRIREKSE